MSFLPESLDENTREKSGGRAVLGLLLALIVIFGGAYAAAHYAAGDKVPRNTVVSGVKIGGKSQSVAAEALEEGLADRVTRPIKATIDGKPANIDPANAGLAVDYEASVAEAGGKKSWNPIRLWNYFTGGDESDAVVTVDDARFETTLASLDEQYGVPAEDGVVVFDGPSVKTTDAVVGKALDPEITRTALVEAYLAEDAQQPDLELQATQPDIDQDDVDNAVASFANPAAGSPVSLDFDGSKVKITPAEYLPAVSLQPQDGTLVPVLDTEALGTVLDEKVEVDGGPVDATVRLVNGKPKVIPGKPGVEMDRAQVESGFLDLVAQPDPAARIMTVNATTAKPEFTTKDAKALGIKERVSTFTTYYPYAEYRNINIGRAAQLVNGTILKPGETFSLNDTVGERTRENGFTEGFIISDGIFKEDLGGGVSQMATTTFNAMFFAGLKDIEHKPHSFYIDRYPVGREATVAWGAVDLKFQNDTDHGILIQANVTPATGSSSGVVTVSMWSTKTWDITTSTGPRYNLTPPKTRTLTTEDCYPNTGYGGFDIDVKRYFHKPGSSDVVKTENFHTTYIPSDTVICKPPKPAKPAKDKQ